jgi:hypothetical protein
MFQKFLILILTFPITYLSADPNFSYSFILEKDATFQGTTFSKGSEILLSDEGQIYQVILAKDQKIGEMTFKDAFPHTIKKGSLLNYASLFSGNQMKLLPSTIHTVEGQEIFSHPIPAKCKLEPSYSVLTFGAEKEYEVSFVQLQCPFDFQIRKKTIKKGKEIQIHSKDKITFYNEKFEVVEL